MDSHVVQTFYRSSLKILLRSGNTAECICLHGLPTWRRIEKCGNKQLLEELGNSLIKSCHQTNHFYTEILASENAVCDRQLFNSKLYSTESLASPAWSGVSDTIILGNSWEPSDLGFEKHFSSIQIQGKGMDRYSLYLKCV